MRMSLTGPWLILPKETKTINGITKTVPSVTTEYQSAYPSTRLSTILPFLDPLLLLPDPYLL